MGEFRFYRNDILTQSLYFLTEVSCLGAFNKTAAEAENI